MKRVSIFLFVFFLLVASSCNLDTPTQSIQPSLTGLFSSRGNNDDIQLPEGSQILLNASGGLEVENEIFTLNGTQWTNETDLRWNDSPQETYITALYPVYEDKRYSALNLYSENGLKDILIAQDTLSSQGKIELQFKHLFAQLSINIDEELLENLSEIQLTVPSKISDISTEGILSITEESHTTIKETNGTCDYTFLLPPLTNCVLTLTLVMSDNSLHETHLPSHSFHSGFQYTCNLLPDASCPGIRTAKDLIAFSQLINGNYSGEKTLEDFGEQVNGTTVYRLLNDITLSAEECSQLQPIGGTESKAFSDTFDGGGHTITNFILPDTNTLSKYTGLFGFIGSLGVVKNLHINQASSITSPSCTQIGVIAAKNNGTINNCSVSNSNIYSVEYGSIGLIAAISSGNIVNCYSQSNTIYVQSYTFAGAVAGTADGYILNCFTQNNTFKEKGTKHRAGCIAGASSGKSLLTIENCYTYHSNSNSYWGAVISKADKVSLNGIYYNKGSYYYEKTSTTVSQAIKYDTNYCHNSTPVTQLLNEWITESTDYPEYTFKNWNMENGLIHFD